MALAFVLHRHAVLRIGEVGLTHDAGTQLRGIV
jgi:hypothetical protein